MTLPIRSTAFVILGTLLVSTSLTAQWIKYPTAGVPRKADGSVNMAAPTPRMADGKPDFSGIWMTGEPNRPATGGVGPINAQPPDQCRLPTTSPAIPKPSRHRVRCRISAWIFQEACRINRGSSRSSRSARPTSRSTIPTSECLPDNFLRAYGLPHLLKFVHTPGLLVVLNEMNAGYRQVFTDARPLPQDPTPSWQGYSSAKWSGDTLVVDTIGLRDDTWIDWNGSVLTEAAKVREQIRRPDFGHLEIVVTVDDPKAYTKPWTVTLKQRIVVDTDLIDEICLENEKFLEHVK